MNFNRVSALAIGLFLSAALSGTVLAADVEAPPVAHDWTGFYVGGHFGYGWIDVEGAYDSSEGNSFSEDGGDFDMDDSGILGGAQIGYNHQIDNFVLGVEADFSFLGLDDELDNGDELVSFDTDYLFSLRARAGYAFDNMMIYATAGAAWTNTNFYANDHIDDTDGDEKGHKRLNDVGLVVGGGGAYAFDDNWSIRAEGLYYYFDDKQDTDDLTHDSDENDFAKLNDMFVVRVGIDYAFKPF
jgi:outer membrane immunogenic protein